MDIYDAHQDIAGNIQLVSGKDFFKRNALSECYLKSDFSCVNQVDYPRIKDGGVRLIFATVFADTKRRAIEQFKIYRDIIKREKLIVPILSCSDLKNLGKGEIGFLFNMEGAAPLEQVEDLDIFYKLGLRSLGIAWRGGNKYIDGKGLSAEGKRLINIISRKPIILDLAHCGKELFWDVVGQYNKPLIVSHTACASIHPDERNLSDEQIREVSKRNGVIGIAGVNLLVGGQRIDNIVSNIKHTVSVSSINNVCFGSDFDGMVNPKLSLIRDFEDVSCFPNLIKELSLFFKHRDIEKIAYKNLRNFILRIL